MSRLDSHHNIHDVHATTLGVLMGMVAADLEAANLLNEAAPEPEMLASFPPAVVVVWRSLTIRTT